MLPGTPITLARPVFLDIGQGMKRYFRGSLQGIIISLYRGDVIVSWDDATIAPNTMLSLDDIVSTVDYEASLTLISLGRRTASLLRARDTQAKKERKARVARATRLRASLPAVKGTLTRSTGESDVEAIRAKLAELF